VLKVPLNPNQSINQSPSLHLSPVLSTGGRCVGGEMPVLLDPVKVQSNPIVFLW